MKKKYSVKILSFLLSCAVLCSSAGFLAAAGAKGGVQDDTLSPISSKSDAETGTALQKNETVYVFTQPDGSVKNIIVSDWIKNALQRASVQDETELENIFNVKGDESYTENGSSKEWDAQGHDLYYQGTIRKELPVNLTIRYQLDGRDISYQELAGKSGSVTIRFSYENCRYQMVTINGTEEKIYVPFAVLTGFVLDNAVFRNVCISNGKIINDGDHTVVAGIAFPGLSESLGLDPSKLEIPAYIELTADVANFSFGTAYTLATNEIFNKIDLSGAADSAGELKESLSGLTDAISRLLDGSSAVYDGLSALLEKSGDLTAGIDRLAGGGKSLSSGAADLQAGAAALAGGLHALNANRDTLDNAAKQIFESLLAAADTQIAAAGLQAERLTIGNYSKVLDGLIASLDETAVRKTARDTALKQVETAVRAQESTVRTQVEAAVRKTVLEQILQTSGMSMTAEQYESAVVSQQIPADVQAKIAGALAAQLQTDAIQLLIRQNTEEQIQMLIAQNMQSRDVAAKVEEAVNAAKKGAASLAALKTQLQSYHEFYNGLLTYTGGVSDAATGADRLLEGLETLSGGANALYEGIGELQNGAAALIDGIAQLKDGALQLSDGLREFDEQGVQKLADAAEGGLKGLFERLRAISDVSRAYRTFAGISEEMEGSVKFIYKTDAVK
ncbi:MAG: hypothetical protein ACLSVG_11505 [Clostridia bacterium]